MPLEMTLGLDSPGVTATPAGVWSQVSAAASSGLSTSTTSSPFTIIRISNSLPFMKKTELPAIRVLEFRAIRRVYVHVTCVLYSFIDPRILRRGLRAAIARARRR